MEDLDRYSRLFACIVWYYRLFKSIFDGNTVPAAIASIMTLDLFAVLLLKHTNQLKKKQKQTS